MKKIILASSSIYRQELLNRLQLPFECESPEVDESRHAGETVPALIERLSRAKARVIAAQFPDAICIGSDEVAALGDTQVELGKPGTVEVATQQLEQMSGKAVDFYTGVCVIAPRQELYELVMTRVYFRELTSTMIANYLAKEKPLNSAASFKSETLGSALITKIESEDPTAIVGLPMIKLCEMLEKVGVEIL